MNRIADTRTKRVFAAGEADGVPSHVARRAKWLIHPLLAAHDLQDVGIIGPISRRADAVTPYGLVVSGKWHLGFVWHPGLGAAEIRLERW
jgi:hypothetical protein